MEVIISLIENLLQSVISFSVSTTDTGTDMGAFFGRPEETVVELYCWHFHVRCSLRSKFGSRKAGSWIIDPGKHQGGN